MPRQMVECRSSRSPPNHLLIAGSIVTSTVEASTSQGANDLKNVGGV
jgi:hypothetical protein